MHFNFPILIILFPIFHNFLSVVFRPGVIYGVYMYGGICPGVFVRGYLSGDICPRTLLIGSRTYTRLFEWWVYVQELFRMVGICPVGIWPGVFDLIPS